MAVHPDPHLFQRLSSNVPIALALAADLPKVLVPFVLKRAVFMELIPVVQQTPSLTKKILVLKYGLI